MKMYIFRDIWSGRIFKVYDNSAMEAKSKVAKLKNINSSNLAHVKPQEVRKYA